MWRIQIHSDIGNYERFYTTFESAISFLNHWNPREISWARISENFEGKWHTRFTMGEN